MARVGQETPLSLGPLREKYFKHCVGIIDALARLSFDLTRVPQNKRITELHQRLEKINSMIFRLMYTKGKELEAPPEEAMYYSQSLPRLEVQVGRR